MWLVETKLWPNSQLPTYIKLLGHNWTTKDILLFFLSILPANCKAGISAYSVIQKSRHILNRRSSTTARILQNWKHKKTSALVIQEVSPKRERFTWSPPLLFFVKMSNSMFAKTRFDRDRRSNLPFQKLHINHTSVLLLQLLTCDAGLKTSIESSTRLQENLSISVDTYTSNVDIQQKCVILLHSRLSGHTCWTTTSSISQKRVADMKTTWKKMIEREQNFSNGPCQWDMITHRNLHILALVGTESNTSLCYCFM